MTGSVLFVRRVGTTLREARVPRVELALLQQQLVDPADVLAHSFAASEALAIIETAIAKAEEARPWAIPDPAAGAIHRALEQMEEAGTKLPSGLHDLRALVTPST